MYINVIIRSMETKPEYPIKNEALSSENSFEEALFANGIYIHDPEGERTKEESTQEHGAHGLIEWCRENFFSEMRSRLPEAAQREQDCCIYPSWREFFSGMVPKNWDTWLHPFNDFEQAGELNVQLSPTLVYAGVLYPQNHVVLEAGKTQLLSEVQLAICLARTDLPNWVKEEILTTQKRRGVTDAQIASAKYLVETRRNALNQESDSTPSPDISNQK